MGVGITVLVHFFSFLSVENIEYKLRKSSLQLMLIAERMINAGRSKYTMSIVWAYTAILKILKL